MKILVLTLTSGPAVLDSQNLNSISRASISSVKAGDLHPSEPAGYRLQIFHPLSGHSAPAPFFNVIQGASTIPAPFTPALAYPNSHPETWAVPLLPLYITGNDPP